MRGKSDNHVDEGKLSRGSNASGLVSADGRNPRRGEKVFKQKGHLNQHHTSKRRWF